MKSNWIVAKTLVIILILSRGYYHFVPFIHGNPFPFYHMELSSILYLPSVVIAVIVLLSAIIFLLTKQATAKKVLGVSILIDSIYFMLYSLITFIPEFTISWHILILCLVISVLEWFTGKKTLEH
ncbi:hypothetical protein DFQ00_11567 [Paenibacillus barcinonensis]|uniref:Uncharacterized protein n=1 Tax=Paenibacillus barcinonensis TaxID=198119 RepID=A0A2V4VYN5_PAEBA|nr:hypothetical protein DFQ00_11567 [Paenibacillus barcinonensis]